jgi:hypothetical protein
MRRAGVVAGRVLEGAAGAGFFGLVVPQLQQLPPEAFVVAPAQGKACGSGDTGQPGVAVAVFDGGGGDPLLADADAFEEGEDLVLFHSRVHRQHPSQGAGELGDELEARQVVLFGEAEELPGGGRRPDLQGLSVDAAVVEILPQHHQRRRCGGEEEVVGPTHQEAVGGDRVARFQYEHLDLRTDPDAGVGGEIYRFTIHGALHLS